MRRFYLAYRDRLPQIRQNMFAELPAPEHSPNVDGRISTERPVAVHSPLVDVRFPPRAEVGRVETF